jgi:hypothetical protein
MTTANLSAAYLANNATLSGTSIVPTSGGLSSFEFILAVPILAAGATVSLHITGTFRPSTSVGFNSALSADLPGYTTSAQWFVGNGTSDPVLTTPQTIDVTFGPGLDHYDDAIAAGEFYVIVNPVRSSGITAVTYDVTGTTPLFSALRRRRLSPLRRYPRNDGLAGAGVPRGWPPPQSTQASNRRVGGYL